MSVPCTHLYDYGIEPFLNTLLDGQQDHTIDSHEQLFDEISKEGKIHDEKIKQPLSYLAFVSEAINIESTMVGPRKKFLQVLSRLLARSPLVILL